MAKDYKIDFIKRNTIIYKTTDNYINQSFEIAVVKSVIKIYYRPSIEKIFTIDDDDDDLLYAYASLS